MEINYCRNCHSRVSSVDIDAGKGLAQPDGKIFCDSCVKELGLTAAPQQPASRSSSGRLSAVQRKKAGSGPQTAVRRKPGSSPVRGSTKPGSGLQGTAHITRGERHVPQKTGVNPAVIVLAIIIVALIAAVGFLVLKGKATQSTPAPVPEVPDTPQGTEVEPVTDTPVPPVQTTSGLQLPAGVPAVHSGYTDLAGNGWDTRLNARQGKWTLQDSILVGTIGGDTGAGILVSNQDIRNGETFCTFAVTATCTIELRFRESNNEYGRISMQAVQPGTWHALAFTVKDNALSKAVFNNQDCLNNRNPRVRITSGEIPDSGLISLMVNPMKYGQVLCGVREISYKPEPAASVTAAIPVPPATRAFSGNWDKGRSIDLHQPTNGVKLENPISRGPAGEAVFKENFNNILIPFSGSDFRLEGEMQHKGSGSDISYLGIYFGQKIFHRTVRKTVYFMFHDGTLMEKEYPSRKQVQRASGFRSGEWVSFICEARNGKIVLSIQGDEKLKSTIDPEFLSGGVLLGYNVDQGSSYTVSLRNLRLYLPDQVTALQVPESTAASPDGNLLPAGDFESGNGDSFAGWTMFDKPGVSTFRDTVIAHGGNSAVRMENFDTTKGKARMFFPLSVEPQREYRVSFWMKTEDFSAVDTSGCLVLTDQNEYIMHGNYNYKRTQDWTQYAKTFKSGANTSVRIYMGVWDGTSGKVWYDDLVITAIGGSAGETLSASPAGDAIPLFTGTALINSGWSHRVNPAGEHAGFVYANGKATFGRIAERLRIAKSVPGPVGELAFDYNFTGGGYWGIDLYASNKQHLDFGFQAPQRGRHSVIIRFNGEKPLFIFDGKPDFSRANVKVEHDPAGPLGGNIEINISIPARTTVEISNMIYRKTAGTGLSAAPAPAVESEPKPPAAAVSGQQSKVLQQGLDGYSGCTDTYVRKDRSNSNGSSSIIQIETSRGRSTYEDLYIHFDLLAAGIPAKAKITKAKLALYCSRENNYEDTFDVYRLLSAWDGSLNDEQAKTLDKEIYRKGQKSNMSSRKVVQLNPPKEVSIDIGTAAQVWADDPQQNFGLLMMAPKSGSNVDMEFHSSESSSKQYRPRLEIEWEAGDATAADTAETAQPEAAAAAETTAPAEPVKAQAVSIDFEASMPNGASGRASRRIKQGRQAIESVKARSGGYEAEIIIPLTEPMMLTAAGRLQLMYYGMDAKKVNVGFRGKDAAGNAIEAGYVTFGFTQKKWNTVDLAITDLKVKGKPAAAGMVIEELVFQAGFKGAETKAKLYVDNIKLIP